MNTYVHNVYGSLFYNLIEKNYILLDNMHIYIWSIPTKSVHGQKVESKFQTTWMRLSFDSLKVNISIYPCDKLPSLFSQIDLVAEW